jgi:hypothetical protein
VETHCHTWRQLLNESSELRKTFAAVALWSHEPENPVYQGIVRDALNAPLRSEAEEMPAYCAGPAIAVLSEHGAKALKFEPELQALASSTNHLKHLADNALTRIRGGTNYIQIRKL